MVRFRLNGVVRAHHLERPQCPSTCQLDFNRFLSGPLSLTDAELEAFAVLAPRRRRSQSVADGNLGSKISGTQQLVDPAYGDGPKILIQDAITEFVELIGFGATLKLMISSPAAVQAPRTVGYVLLP